LHPNTCFYEAQRGKKLHASTVSPQRQGDKAKLLDRVRDTIRVKHYSLRTENAIQSIDAEDRQLLAYHAKIGSKEGPTK
jgi:hypothetical protein